jgi:hypothetical protein
VGVACACLHRTDQAAGQHHSAAMQFQSIFDSVCRCFGHPTEHGDGAGGPNSSQSGAADNASQASAKRRTGRLELKDKRWDDVFEKHQQMQGGRKPSGAARTKPPVNPENDVGVAHAVAQAKLAANPPRYRTKRKRSGKARDEIFRSKEHPILPPRAQQNPSTLSRLLNPSIALCFATPVRGTEEEQDEADLRSIDNSDTNTLNTCEDTITSTVYFENKYSHLVETRPPMPLFNQFKLKHEKDEIRNIIATDSHSSLNMIQLLQQQQREAQREPVQLEDSSSDSDQGRRRRKERRDPGCLDQEMEDVPDVKAVSSSTDSSRQSNAAVQSSPS